MRVSVTPKAEVVTTNPMEEATMSTYAMEVNWAGSPSNRPNWGSIGNWSGFGSPIASLSIIGDGSALSGAVTFASNVGGPYSASLTWNSQSQSYAAALIAGDNGFTETWNFNNG